MAHSLYILLILALGTSFLLILPPFSVAWIGLLIGLLIFFGKATDI